MKYSCDVIKDLLPLYKDGVCSEESAKAVKEHLEECESCKQDFDSMSEPKDELVIKEYELKKAESFKNIKRAINTKKVMTCLVCVIIVIAVMVVSSAILKNIDTDVKKDARTYINSVNGYATLHLMGSEIRGFDCRIVKATWGEKEENIMFYCLRDTPWDRLVNGKRYNSSLMLPVDFSKIDKVYYYEGDFDVFEREMQGVELQKIAINDSRQIYRREYDSTTQFEKNVGWDGFPDSIPKIMAGPKLK